MLAAMAAFAGDTSPERPASLADDYQFDSMVRNFERDTMELIDRNQNMQFDVYFPPYSILQFVAMCDSSPTTLKIVYDFTPMSAKDWRNSQTSAGTIFV
jgi:hypothetical protein